MRQFTLPALLLAGLIAAGFAAASPESRALIEEGAAALETRGTEAALDRFEAAALADPKDAAALFFQGVALNRLGRPEDALSRLSEAAAMGARNPDLDFETGWSLVALGRWQDAIAALEDYEAAHPGRGKVSEFLGRAHLALGQHAEAEKRLFEAMRRDEALRPTVLFHMALLEQARGNSPAARAYLKTLIADAPDSPFTRALIQRFTEEPSRPAAAPEEP